MARNQICVDINHWSTTEVKAEEEAWNISRARKWNDTEALDTKKNNCRNKRPHFHVWVQAVLNAAARLVFRLRRYDHVTDALAILHWLRVPCAGTSQFPAGADGVPCAERYGAVVPESTCSGIQPYWSSASTIVFHTAAARPVIPSVNSRPSLVSGRSLYVLEHSARWHSIWSAPSVSAFRRLLKTFLFQHSFPDVIL